MYYSVDLFSLSFVISEVFCSPIPVWDYIVPDIQSSALYTKVNYTCAKDYVFKDNQTFQQTMCKENALWDPPFQECGKFYDDSLLYNNNFRGNFPFLLPPPPWDVSKAATLPHSKRSLMLDCCCSSLFMERYHEWMTCSLWSSSPFNNHNALILKFWNSNPLKLPFHSVSLFCFSAGGRWITSLCITRGSSISNKHRHCYSCWHLYYNSINGSIGSLDTYSGYYKVRKKACNE